MAIVDVRIDDRLIHGQVCGLWVPHHNVNKIVIIDNKIVNDEMRKSALKLGCPGKVKLSILDALTASDKLKRNLDKGDNVMLLCSNPSPLLEMVEDGYSISRIVVGNMSPKSGYAHVKRTIYLSDEDIVAFKKLAAKNVELVIQIAPDDSPENLAAIVNGL